MPTPLESPTEEPPEIQQILTLWFSDLPPNPASRWFMPNPDLDAHIKSTFEPLVVAARDTSSLETWTATPQGTLALILLLDQFPRNIYRQSKAHLAYASDHKAQRVATEMIARGADRDLSFYGQAFVYTVYMHAEDLAMQVLGVSLQEGLVARAEADADSAAADNQEDPKWGGHEKDLVQKSLRASLAYSRRHLEAVRRFGRFCGRNKFLGRESTGEEKEYLQENPMGF